jgi:hypothetical protein
MLEAKREVTECEKNESKSMVMNHIVAVQSPWP